MTIYQQLINDYRKKLVKAIDYLEYSYHQAKSLSTDYNNLGPEELQVWESLAARFARVVDLFLTKYIRAAVNNNDPGFAGTLRDYVNRAEKLGLLKLADHWMEFRELRNIVVHEYADEQFSRFVEQLRRCAPELLELKKTL